LETFDFLIDVRDALSKGISRHATACASDVLEDLIDHGCRVLLLAECHQASVLAGLSAENSVTLAFAPYNEYFARFDISVLNSINTRFRVRHSHSFAQFLDPRLGSPSSVSASIYDLTRLHFGRASLVDDDEFSARLGPREFENMRQAIDYLADAVGAPVGDYSSRMEEYIRLHARFVLSRAEFVCVPSRGVIEEIMHYLDVSDLRNVVIQGPTRFPSFYEESKEVRRRRLREFNLPKDFVLFVGTPDWHKRLDLVLEYLADGDSGRHDIGKVVVVGDEAGDNLFERLDGYKAREGQIARLGYVSDEVLRSLYAEAAFTVIPSISEGYCLPLDEALLSGGAVVVSDLPILRERVQLAAGRAVAYSPLSASSFWSAIRELPSRSGRSVDVLSRRRSIVSELLSKI